MNDTETEFTLRLWVVSEGSSPSPAAMQREILRLLQAPRWLDVADADGENLNVTVTDIDLDYGATIVRTREPVGQEAVEFDRDRRHE